LNVAPRGKFDNKSSQLTTMRVTCKPESMQSQCTQQETTGMKKMSKTSKKLSCTKPTVHLCVGIPYFKQERSLETQWYKNNVQPQQVRARYW